MEENDAVNIVDEAVDNVVIDVKYLALNNSW